MRRTIIIIGFLFFALAGCTRSAITVDDEKISKELFEYSLKEKIGTHKAMNINADSEAVKKAVTNELIGKALLLREVKAKKISVTDEEVQKTIDGMLGGTKRQEFIEQLLKQGMSYDIFEERVRNNLLISKLMDSLVRDDGLTEEELSSYFLESRDLYVHPEQVFVKILQISNETDAKKASEELENGADFDTLAKDMGDAKRATASNYGWINPDILPSEELATAMKTAEIDVFSGPLKGKDKSYYFFKIKERNVARELTFEEARPRVKRNLLRKKRQELAASIIETGRKTAKIKINM